MIHLLVVWLVISLSLFIISKLSFLGVEIDDYGIALQSAAVFGILNAIVGGLLRFVTFPLNFLSLGLVYLLINAFIFGLTAQVIEGFRLKNGWISVLLGSLALSIINSVLFSLLV